MCVEGCQTRIWGGNGIPAVDEDGFCTCACDNGWSDHNILGQASCVPQVAHRVFSACGLALSVTVLCQALYQFHRQAKYHERVTSASTSPIEQCRRFLHIVAAAEAVVSILYFVMLLALDEWLGVSNILLAGVIQIIVNIGGVVTIRMWIYTNDSRLMQETPEILVISNALEQPRVRRLLYSAVSLPFVVATTVAAVGLSLTAVVIASLTFAVNILIGNMIVWRCGSSLLRTINGSIQQSRAASPVSASNRSGMSVDHEGRRKAKGGVLDLAAAKRKLKIAMCYCSAMAVEGLSIILFANISTYGKAAPLIFFGIPLGIGPHAWFGFNIQIHAGRTKPAATQRSKPGPTSANSQLKMPSNIVTTVKSSLSGTTGQTSTVVATRSRHVVLPSETTSNIT